MISIATFSELVANLHAGPFEDESWQRFLTLLCESTELQVGSSSATHTATAALKSSPAEA